MAEHHDLDEKDLVILKRLEDRPRERATDIAEHVDLTPTAVRRRIERLERLDVIRGLMIDYDKLAPHVVEAFVELSFPGNENVDEKLREALTRPEVREAMTLAGEPDALVRVRVPDLPALRRVALDLRKIGNVTGSNTHIVLGRWPGGAARSDAGGR